MLKIVDGVIIRLQTRYETGAATTENHPATVSTQKTMVFALDDNGDDFSNAQIEALPQSGTWKVEYFSSTAANSQPVATQYFKTTSRTLTIDGFKKMVKMPVLTDTMLNRWGNTNEGLTGTTYCDQTLPTEGPFSLLWSTPHVPGLEAATFMARIYGRKDKTVRTSGFEDSINFGASTRSIAIRCGQGESSVLSYCQGASPAAANFKSTQVSIDAVDLVSRAPDGNNVTQFYAMGKMK